MRRLPQNLYRPYNKTAHGFHAGRPGGAYNEGRHSNAILGFEGHHLSIGRSRVGYDYTPLYRFLLSKVGCSWDEIYSEAVARLDKREPIFRLVNLHDPKDAIVCVGESTYFSALTVLDGILVKVDETAVPPEKRCTCCTHTFNEVPY